MNYTAFGLVMFIVGQIIGVGLLASGIWTGLIAILGTIPTGYIAITIILETHFNIKVKQN